MTASLSRSGAHHGARSPTTSAKVSWLCTSQRCASSSARSTRPWCALSATISCSRPPATGEIGSAMNRGISTSSTSEATSASRSLRSPMASTLAPSATTRPALAGSLTQTPTRRAMSAETSRSRITCSLRKFSEKNSSRLLPNSSLRRGISAVCGIGSPSGCRNSAVTANQSAMAPTMLASAPALTKPRKPSWSRVATYTIAAKHAAVRRPRPSSGAAGSGVRRRPGTRSEVDGGLGGDQGRTSWLPETYPTADMSLIGHLCFSSAPPLSRPCWLLP